MRMQSVKSPAKSTSQAREHFKSKKNKKQGSKIFEMQSNANYSQLLHIYIYIYTYTHIHIYIYTYTHIYIIYILYYIYYILYYIYTCPHDLSIVTYNFLKQSRLSDLSEGLSDAHHHGHAQVT